MKRVKRIEDLHIRTTRAQGIVGVGATIRRLTAWCQPEGYLPTDKDGSLCEMSNSSCR
jgi:hypothetical protein